uniref:Ras-related protein Rab-12 n=1 Tax=Anser brachyrhynchus TaxID=132585 RepID=A0A8B9CKT3_9AVES
LSLELAFEVNNLVCVVGKRFVFTEVWVWQRSPPRTTSASVPGRAGKAPGPRPFRHLRITPGARLRLQRAVADPTTTRGPQTTARPRPTSTQAAVRALPAGRSRAGRPPPPALRRGAAAPALQRALRCRAGLGGGGATELFRSRSRSRSRSRCRRRSPRAGRRRWRGGRGRWWLVGEPGLGRLQVIIIGSRGVGKTSLMERFTDDTFCEACKSTVGVDFKIKTVELRGKKIRLQIWDTAGQERFNSITSAYYRSAKGIILVYDITKKETFDDLPKWMKMIDKYASEDAELLLVGNKLDCEVDREISRQQGEKFAQQITGMRFCEASAKDNFNVDEIFLKLVDDILKKMPLDVIRNELSNSILSLQPEPEIPPELPPPRPHVRCC